MSEVTTNLGTKICTVEVNVHISYWSLMECVRKVMDVDHEFNHRPWSIGDAEDLEMLARAIRRGYDGEKR